MPGALLDSVEQTALTRAKATLLMKVMLERVANELEARKKTERQAGEKKTKNVERHVLDEAGRIVEDGGRRQSSKFAEKRLEPSCPLFCVFRSCGDGDGDGD